jgi:uncharacterized membrane protein
MPILELRGGLIAASLLNMKALPSLIVCLIANILIIPFVLFLMEGIFNLLSKIKVCKRAIEWWKNKALSKKDIIEKYGYLGIMLFVAVPLPGSGAWTGCLIAVLLGLDKKKSFVAALLGVVIAAIIMMIFSFGILKGILN